VRPEARPPAAQPQSIRGAKARTVGVTSRVLTAQKVTPVGMESTGIYWKPVYYVLENNFPV
jgi:hypothetical protein